MNWPNSTTVRPANGRGSGIRPARGLLLGHLPFQLGGRKPDDVLVLVRVDLVRVRGDLLELEATAEDVGLPALLLAVARMEIRHHLPREQLEARADVLVGGASGLVQEDHLIDVGALKLPEPPPDRLRRADQAAPERLLRLGRLAPPLVELPHVAGAGGGDAVSAVVAQAEDEERPAGRLRLRRLVRLGAHEAA